MDDLAISFHINLLPTGLVDGKDPIQVGCRSSSIPDNRLRFKILPAKEKLWIQEYPGVGQFWKEETKVRSMAARVKSTILNAWGRSWSCFVAQSAQLCRNGTVFDFRGEKSARSQLSKTQTCSSLGNRGKCLQIEAASEDCKPDAA